MGTQLPSAKRDRAAASNFRPIFIVAKRLEHQDATWCGGRPRPRRLCVRWGPSYPQRKWHTHPTQFLAHVYYGQTAGWMNTSLRTEVDLGTGHTVLDVVPAVGERGTAASPLFAHVCCGHGRPSQLLLSSCYWHIKRRVSKNVQP